MNTMCAPDDSETGTAANDDTMAPATVVVPDMTRTQAGPELAWSTESDDMVIEDSATGVIDTRSWGQTLAITAAVLVAAPLTVAAFFFLAGLLGLHTTSTDTTGMSTQPVTEVLAAPTTVVPPPVTVTEAAPSTAPVQRPTWSTPPDEMFITLLADTADGWTVPASDRARTIAEGRNICTQIRAGTSSQTLIDTTAAQQGISWDSANTFVSASITAFCRDKAGSN